LIYELRLKHKVISLQKHLHTVS